MTVFRIDPVSGLSRFTVQPSFALLPLDYGDMLVSNPAQCC